LIQHHGQKEKTKKYVFNSSCLSEFIYGSQRSDVFFFPFWLPFNATNLVLHFFPIALGATFTDPTSGGIFPG
jgi:hypothetical protein